MKVKRMIFFRSVDISPLSDEKDAFYEDLMERRILKLANQYRN